MLSHIALLALTISPSLASSPSSSKLKERIYPPRNWVQQSRPSPDTQIELRFGLVQQNFSGLERRLYEVSDPTHEKYGQHLSKAEVEELIAPRPESVELVMEYLSSFGVDRGNVEMSSAGDWVFVSVPIGVAEGLLDTTYHVWRHVESGDQIVRTTSYSVPEHLDAHIDLVHPTTMFGRPRAMRATVHSLEVELVTESEFASSTMNLNSAVPGVDLSCNGTITIACLRQLYNVSGYTPSSEDVSSGSSIGVTGYLEEFANIQDLQAFYADQRPDAVNSSFEFISVKGGKNSQNISEAGSEANLDVQFAFGLSYPIKSTFYSTAGRPPFKPDAVLTENMNEPYNDWLDFVLANDSGTPLVISTSYGEPEQTIPESYALRACAGFAQLGARGVSLLFSSGDGGVAEIFSNSTDDPKQCITNDGRNATKFMPAFPASCPYVTTVGGTTQVPEIAANFSGGGFSNYWERPSYQEEAVKAYLDRLPEGTYKDLFNPNGRAYPDVAAQSTNFRIFYQGKAAQIGGTSAAAPAFAGLVALLNDARLRKGMGPLGFLNPLLYNYKLGNAFNDITKGNNPGCGTEGFNATEGWDPATTKVQDALTKRVRSLGEDLNQYVKQHISSVVSASPSRSVATLEQDTVELLASGMVTLNAKLNGVEDDKLLGRVVDRWGFFWEQVLTYVEGVLLPLQNDPLFSSLYSGGRRGPGHAAGKSSISGMASSSHPAIDVRTLALRSFRDKIILPLSGRLYTRLAMSVRLEEQGQAQGELVPARLSQMLLVLNAQARARPPAFSLTAAPPQLSPGETAVNDLLRLVRSPRRGFGPGNKSLGASNMNARMSVKSSASFLSGGVPRDRRGRVAMKLKDRDKDPNRTKDLDETPRNTQTAIEREREREFLDSLKSPDIETTSRANQGGWGLGPGPGKKEEAQSQQKDEDEFKDWDQAQAELEKMIGIEQAAVVHAQGQAGRRRMT
ncbi:hypothetical protein V5O48_000228 [Marasmius crinis-equi]|uniref:tripeptidyl-peptidase II n=1 Tax=Marasmius crinis-equi TaxID=585013 RepID=A0ABR3G1Y9_9AGAR